MKTIYKLKHLTLILLSLLFLYNCKPPKMKIINVAGPTKQDCGGFRWDVRFQLDNPSPKGGFFVQEINATRAISKKCPKNCKAINFSFYEAWQVKPGKKFTIYKAKGFKMDDIYRFPDCPHTKGSTIIKGKIRFFEGLTLPKSFKKNNPKTAAGILPSTTKKPKFWNSKSTLAHDLTSKWNCCGAKPVHNLNVIPSPLKKKKTTKKVSKNGTFFKIFEKLNPWTKNVKYTDEENAYLLEIARQFIRNGTVTQEAFEVDLRNYVTYYENDLDELSKVYIFLRFLFDLPTNMPIDNIKSFGGWVRPKEITNEETYNLSWPVSVQKNEEGNLIPMVTDTFLGYFGANYDAMGEFNYFKENFTIREL